MSRTTLPASDIPSELENLVLDAPEFTVLENKLKVFCPFEAVNMVHAEIRHSSFLATMMDPYRPHGFGIQFLRILIDSIVKTLSSEEVGISRLELHTTDFENADVRQEWNRIDVLVVLKDIKLVIVFELKIHARESRGQLTRYRQAVEKQWPSSEWKHLLLLLTPQGDEPSDEAWKEITYETVVETIDAFLVTEKNGVAMARYMLGAYAEMMRREHMEDAELSEIAVKLWKEHREALTFLMENQPDATGGLGERLKNEASAIGTAASGTTITLKSDVSSANVTRFYVSEWDDSPAMKTGEGWTNSKRLMLIELVTYRNGVHARLILGPGPDQARERVFEAISERIGKSGSLSPKWKRFFSTWLVKFKVDDDEFDPETVFSSVQAELKVFVGKNIEPVSEAIKDALSGEIK